MMRQARGWHNALRRAQAARRERREDAASDETATRVEKRALQLLAEAAAIPTPTAQAALPTSEPAPQTKPEHLTEAEAYAAANPSKAALIRSLGRLPKKFNGEPLSPQLVHDIVNSASPILQALAKRPRHQLEAATA
jgi:hypothetical protein